MASRKQHYGHSMPIDRDHTLDDEIRAELEYNRHGLQKLCVETLNSCFLAVYQNLLTKVQDNKMWLNLPRVELERKLVGYDHRIMADLELLAARAKQIESLEKDVRFFDRYHGKIEEDKTRFLNSYGKATGNDARSLMQQC